MRTLIPGEWYLMFVCKGCKTRQVLFPDLSRGKAKINATYAVSCPKCNLRASYDAEQIERYHPAKRKSISGELSTQETA